MSSSQREGVPPNPLPSPIMMPSIFDSTRNFIGGVFGAMDYNTKPFGVGQAVSPTENIYKAVIPQFLYKPPYGYPRWTDIPEMRRLAATPYVEMCQSTIIDEISAVEWDIVAKDPDKPINEAQRQKILDFLHNPNINKESFEQIQRGILRDILTLDSGIMVKVFDRKGELAEIYARDGGCLSYNNLVETDEGFIPIGTIVKDELTPNVKTYNFEEGCIEWKPIIGHKQSGTSDVWHRIKAKTNTKHRTIEAITHMIPTPEGDVNSDDLKVGDVIYTQQNKLNDTQRQIILGSLLGDGSLRKGSSDNAKYYFKETHCEKQKDYLLWKLENLKELNPVYREYMSAYGDDHKPTLKCEFKTRADIVFEEFAELKYPDFKPSLFYELDVLGLAVWVQDDGYVYPSGAVDISTHNIPKEVQEYGLKALHEKWGIEGKLAHDKRCDKWFMRFNKENGNKIKELIKDVIHPCMEYKFGVSGEPPVEPETELDILETEIYEIQIVNKVDTKYDIEVADNHNFFCNGLLVHNTFTKNPDEFGTMSGRAEIVPPNWAYNMRDGEKEYYLQNIPAYFQYGWITGARPMPFGMKEIIWFQKNNRTDSIYGRSPIEILLDTIQMLVYGIEHNLDYYQDNNMPKGVFKMIGATTEDLRAFSEQWSAQMKVKDDVGNWRKRWHKMPVINTDGAFEKLQFSNAELELIAQQEWFSKLVWACYGVTPSELGYTENSNRATEIVQSTVFRRKAIMPMLSLLEYHYNMELLPEFGEDSNLMFEFNKYDLEEDLKKHNLYEIQLRNNIRTKNEIREELNLDPMEGGDELVERGFNPFDEYEKPTTQEPEKSTGEKQEEKSITKPLSPVARQYIQNCIDEGRDKHKALATLMSFGFDEKEIRVELGIEETPLLPLEEEEIEEELSTYERIIQGKNFDVRDEYKALDGSEPVILRPFEEPIKKLDKVFAKELKKAEKDILALLKKELKKVEGKALSTDIVGLIMNYVKVTKLKSEFVGELRKTYFKGHEDLERFLDLNIKHDPDVVEEVENYGLTLLKDMEEKMKNDIKGAIERGLIDKKGTTEIIKDVKKVFDKNDVRAKAIVRTEIARANNAAQLTAAKSAEDEYDLKMSKEWMATIDNKTCEHCKALNGTKVDMGVSFKSGTFEKQAPPLHPNCRCTLGYEVEDNVEGKEADLR